MIDKHYFNDYDYSSPDFRVATFLFHARIHAITSGANWEAINVLSTIEMGLRFHEGKQ